MKGALIFAFNNELIDYVRLASWSADNIRRHLGIPVAAITDKHLDSHNFDQVIYVNKSRADTRYFDDYGESADWHNTSRPSALDLSPWDQTLVLDADYVVASSDLKTILNTKHNFLAHRLAFDVTQQNDFHGLNYFGLHAMPQWWATVMYFRRSKEAEMIFAMMTMVKNNWTHYKNIYNIGRSLYRNDYALSIALNTVNGHTQQIVSIPWNLATAMPNNTITRLEKDSYKIDYNTSEKKSKYIVLQSQDFHAMGKKQLEKIIGS